MKSWTGLTAALVRSALMLWMTLAPLATQAATLVDHRLDKDTGGIYRLQDAVPVGLGLFAAGCALWRGTADTLGRTCWESGEAGVAGALLSKGLQWATGRESPAATDSPDHWFGRGSEGSFPSTHVTFTTALVTPVILQYMDSDPWVSVLALLPVYEMVARVKAREHWQTDVIGGAALGLAVGAYEYRRNSPLIFNVFPEGAFVGFRHRFE